MSDLPPPDDLLARSEAALRGAPVPDGPADETVARTLAALHQAGRREPLVRRRRTMIRLAFHLAAAALIAAGGLGYLLGLRTPEAALAFAAVAGELRDAQSLAFRMTVQVPGLATPLQTRMLFKAPGLCRSEDVRSKVVTIGDLKQGKLLLLVPASKTALLQEGIKAYGPQKGDEDKGVQLVERLRKLAESGGQSAGKKQIGDVQAQGFRAKLDGQELTIWADPKTHLPLRVETTVAGPGNQQAQATLDEFQVNPPLDDALFRLEVPAGYEVRKVNVGPMSYEDDVVGLLRAYAEKFDGKFPRSLDTSSPDWQAYIKERWGDKKPAGLPDPEFIRLVQRLVAVAILQRHARGGHGYKPDGAKLGDANQIVFWYRPEGSAKYRAVYADLHVADVTADQLPEKPKD